MQVSDHVATAANGGLGQVVRAMRHQPGKGSYTVSSTRTENPYVQCFPDHADAGVNVARSVHVAPADAGDFAARSVRVAPAYAGDFAARRLAPSAGFSFF